MTVAAQEISVQATIDSTQIKIGQQAEIRIEVIQPFGQIINFPYFQENDRLGTNIEIVSVSPVDTSRHSKNIAKITQKYLVTSFEPGEYTIPPFLFQSEFTKYTTDSLHLVVKGIEIAENAELNDIKPVYEPPFDWKGFLLISLIVLVVIAIISGIVYFIIQKRRNRPIPFFDKKRKELLPHEVALNELDKIKEEKAWQQGLQKLFYTRLTDTLRTYLSKRFGIPAQEMTSSEIIAALRKREDAKIILDKLNLIFSMADMAKFAKYQFSEDENNINLINAYFVVNQTIIQPEINPEEEKKTEKRKTHKIPKIVEITEDPFGPNQRLKELVSSGIEWGIFLRHNTDKLIIPFLFIQNREKRYLRSLETNDDPIKYAKSILDEEKEPFDQFIIGYEGVLRNDAGEKTDGIIVQGFDLAQDNGVAVGQMFIPKEKGEFKKAGKPVFLGTPALIVPKKEGSSPDFQPLPLNIKTDIVTETNGLLTCIVRISYPDSKGVAEAIKDFLLSKIGSDSNNELSGKFEFIIPAEENLYEDFLRFLLNNLITKEMDTPLIRQWNSRTGREMDIICKTGTKVIYRYNK
jgi:hypothetical protein